MIVLDGRRFEKLVDEGRQGHVALRGLRKVLGWPKICQLVYAFLWEYRYKRLDGPTSGPTRRLSHLCEELARQLDALDVREARLGRQLREQLWVLQSSQRPWR